MVTTAMSILGLFFPMVLLTFHCYLFTQGQTTNERAKGLFEFVSPYHRGCWGNVLEIFCILRPSTNVHLHHQPPNKKENEAILNKRKIVYLSAEEAQDSLGGGDPLSQRLCEVLPDRLQEHETLLHPQHHRESDSNGHLQHHEDEDHNHDHELDDSQRDTTRCHILPHSKCNHNDIIEEEPNAVNGAVSVHDANHYRNRLSSADDSSMENHDPTPSSQRNQENGLNAQHDVNAMNRHFSNPLDISPHTDFEEATESDPIGPARVERRQFPFGSNGKLKKSKSERFPRDARRKVHSVSSVEEDSVPSSQQHSSHPHSHGLDLHYVRPTKPGSKLKRKRPITDHRSEQRSDRRTDHKVYRTRSHEQHRQSRRTQNGSTFKRKRIDDRSDKRDKHSTSVKEQFHRERRKPDDSWKYHGAAPQHQYHHQHQHHQQHRPYHPVYGSYMDADRRKQRKQIMSHDQHREVDGHPVFALDPLSLTHSKEFSITGNMTGNPNGQTNGHSNGKVPQYPPPHAVIYDHERDRDNPYLSGWSTENHTITASNNMSSVAQQSHHHQAPAAPHLGVNRAHHLQRQYKYSLSSSNTVISPELSGRYHRDHSLRTTASSDLYSTPSHAHTFHHLYALPRKPYGTTKGGGGGDPRSELRGDSRGGGTAGDTDGFDHRPASLTKFKHSHRHKSGQRSKSHQQQRHGHRVHDHGTSMHRSRAGDPKRTAYAGVPLAQRAMTYNHHHHHHHPHHHRRDVE